MTSLFYLHPIQLVHQWIWIIFPGNTPNPSTLNCLQSSLLSLVEGHYPYARTITVALVLFSLSFFYSQPCFFLDRFNMILLWQKMDHVFLLMRVLQFLPSHPKANSFPYLPVVVASDSQRTFLAVLSVFSPLLTPLHCLLDYS